MTPSTLFPRWMSEYEQLQPLLEECLQRHKTELAPAQNEIEETLLRLLERYQVHVSPCLPLFSHSCSLCSVH